MSELRQRIAADLVPVFARVGNGKLPEERIRKALWVIFEREFECNRDVAKCFALYLWTEMETQVAPSGLLPLELAFWWTDILLTRAVALLEMGLDEAYRVAFEKMNPRVVARRKGDLLTFDKGTV